MRALGVVYGPYTDTCFASTKETDIEHVVVTSEAHDSGLCTADKATRARFAKDLWNLTLASPEVNRWQKSGKDAAEWLPDRNWFRLAGRVLEVKCAYGLTVDPAEAGTLEEILRRCSSAAMQPLVCRSPLGSAAGDSGDSREVADVLARYDDNGNGRITCK